MGRIELMNWWEEIGGLAQTSVTKKTDIVFVGSDPGQGKREKALRYGIPYVPWVVAELVDFAWKREDPLIKLPPGVAKEINVLYLELFDGILAHYILSRDDAQRGRLRELVSLAQGVVEGVLRITRGAPTEGPGGAWRAASLPTNEADYIKWIVAGAAVLARELKKESERGTRDPLDVR